MAATDWGVFLYQTLKDLGPLLAVVQDEANIYGPGRLSGSPEVKPFVVIRKETEVPATIPGRSISTWSVYAHDDPGDYMRTEAALRAVRAALAPEEDGSGQHVGAGVCRWAGDSPGLSDEVLGTIYIYSTYQFFGRDGAVQ
jgi:hypothetical protein